MATEVFASYDNDGTLNEEKLRANLKRAGGTTADDGDLEEEEPGGFPIKVKMDGYIFEIDKYGNITKEGEIASGGEEQGDDPTVVETIPEDTSYAGYYADLDGDEQADGIIYADLAVGSDGEKKWNEDGCSVFEYPSEGETGNVTYKKYVLEEQQGSGFGEEYKKEMIKVADSSDAGADRFYVMALEDVTKDETKTFTWYKNGYDKLNQHNEAVDSGENDFGLGDDNTEYWMKDEYSEEYGGLDEGDIWKVINSELKDKGKTWFVPSKSEWSAFGYMCYETEGINMSTENYGEFGLSGSYWSSSLNSADYAYNAYFNNGYIDNGLNVDSLNYVRLSTTF